LNLISPTLDIKRKFCQGRKIQTEWGEGGVKTKRRQRWFGEGMGGVFGANKIAKVRASQHQMGKEASQGIETSIQRRGTTLKKGWLIAKKKTRICYTKRGTKKKESQRKKTYKGGGRLVAHFCTIVVRGRWMFQDWERGSRIRPGGNLSSKESGRIFG